MKTMFHLNKTTNLLFIILAICCSTAMEAFSQVPRNIPQPGSDQGLDLQSPWHIAFFVVVPVFLIAYLFYTMSRKPGKDEIIKSKKDESEANDESDENEKLV
jgi:hypothetical protein